MGHSALEVKQTLGIPQGSLLGLLIFIVFGIEIVALVINVTASVTICIAFECVKTFKLWPSTRS